MVSAVDSNRKIVVGWLLLVCLTVFMMIVVGGVTRLTNSGLSMVDWKPIMGFIPPIGELEWQETFDAYKHFPEYQKVNKGMSLDEFKGIFYWEYGHRVLGRSIGMIFFVPFIALLFLKKIEKPYVPRLLGALLLGGLQGLMGWYMVMSGLVDMPRVSHYRLAAHLILALVILAYIFWIILDLRRAERFEVTTWFRRACVLLLCVTSLQILYGAFTAGLRAGLGFNTFPLMDGEFLAAAATMMAPFWHNFIENGAMVQFIHRWIGTFLLLLVSLLLVYAIATRLPRKLQVISAILLGITLTQYLLGVMTLLHYVPVALGSTHQAVACLVLLVNVYLVYVTRAASGEDRAEHLQTEVLQVKRHQSSQ